MLKGLSEKQGQVYDLFTDHPDGLTDDELAEAAAIAYGWSPFSSTARSRRAELSGMGYIVDSGDRRLSPAGRKEVVVWRLSDAH